jgi:hypothetical protein
MYDPTPVPGTNLPAAAFAWDIMELYWVGANPAFKRTPCGTTLAFRGKCYQAGAMNYAMWGLMHLLCHTKFDPAFPNPTNPSLWGLRIALTIALGWKLMQGDSIANDTVYQALGFTIFGYSGLLWTRPTSRCRVTGRISRNLAFHWAWEPSKPRPIPSPNWGIK